MSDDKPTNATPPPPRPGETPPVTVTRRDGRYVYRLGDDEYFWDLLKRFERGELPAQRLSNLAVERDLFLVEENGRKYVIKRDRGGWGFGGERSLERFLLKLFRGPFYSRLMRRVARARGMGCDMIQGLHLVVERRTLHYCHEAVAIFDYIEGKMLVEAGDIDAHRPAIREAMLKLHASGLAMCDVSIYNFLVDDEDRIRIIDLVCRGNPRLDRVKDAIRLRNVLDIDIPVEGWLDRLLYGIMSRFQSARRRRVEKHNRWTQSSNRRSRFRS